MLRKHWTVELRERNIRQVKKWCEGKTATPQFRKAMMKKIMTQMFVTRDKAREYLSQSLGDEE